MQALQALELTLHIWGLIRVKRSFFFFFGGFLVHSPGIKGPGRGNSEQLLELAFYVLKAQRILLEHLRGSVFEDVKASPAA